MRSYRCPWILWSSTPPVSWEMGGKGEQPDGEENGYRGEGALKGGIERWRREWAFGTITHYTKFISGNWYFTSVFRDEDSRQVGHSMASST
ncbi:hypothetical protein EVAR_26065_1 [Eumeta japonica]|uniref:Uncharacterized protein n=1 Tax=Eumeta variegata TaxID=151549 RepID=A0A4C1VT44_EUMVA|nr:hypothetical protein EVAR_26065_1 [Eumeta japonica]